MKLIIVCGLRDHTWNQARKDFVSFFFSRELIPDVDPYNVSFPNNVLINASVLNNVPFKAPAPNNSCMPVSSGSSGGSINPPSRIKSRPKLSLRKNAQDVCKAGEKLNLKNFWRQVIWCIRYKGISIRGLTEAAHREAEQRKRRNGASKKQKNIIGALLLACPRTGVVVLTFATHWPFIRRLVT